MVACGCAEEKRRGLPEGALRRGEEALQPFWPFWSSGVGSDHQDRRCEGAGWQGGRRDEEEISRSDCVLENGPQEETTTWSPFLESKVSLVSPRTSWPRHWQLTDLRTHSFHWRLDVVPSDGTEPGHGLLLRRRQKRLLSIEQVEEGKGSTICRTLWGAQFATKSPDQYRDPRLYGLDDAPAAWRATVTDYVVKDLGFCRNLVEPCWFSLYGKDRKPVAQLLVEVDDFVIAAKEDYAETLKEQLMSRFTFGKWEKGEAEYAGRRIKCTKDCIYVNQSKYIIEQVHAVPLARGRRQQKESKLTKEEFAALRSLVFKLNWLGRESRPEASGIASIMASRLPHAVIEDVSTVNKFANYLRSTADREIKIWKFNPKEMVFIVCSDAGGISMKGNYSLDEEGLPTDATQGAWMVLTAEKLPHGRTSVRASPMTWRSSKLKRKVFSTFGGETQAMLQGVNEVDWLQVMYRDAVFNDVSLSSWRNSLSPHMLVLRGECELADRQGQCSVVDAKSLYDCLLRENPSGKQDRKSSLELAIVLRDLQSTKSMVRWVPHQKMVVDPLTKMDPVKANDAMNQLIKSGWLSLVDVSEELANRKSDVAYRRRSHAASERRLLSEYEEQAFCLFTFLLQILVDNNRGDCKDCALESMNPFDQKSWADVPFAKRGLAQDPTVPAPVRKGACAGPMQSESLQWKLLSQQDYIAQIRRSVDVGTVHFISPWRMVGTSTWTATTTIGITSITSFGQLAHQRRIPSREQEWVKGNTKQCYFNALRAGTGSGVVIGFCLFIGVCKKRYLIIWEKLKNHQKTCWQPTNPPSASKVGTYGREHRFSVALRWLGVDLGMLQKGVLNDFVDSFFKVYNLGKRIPAFSGRPFLFEHRLRSPDVVRH